MSLQVTVKHLSGALKDEVVVLHTLPVQIGRADSCGLQFDPTDDTRVSTLHAELFEGDGGVLMIRDLSSQNGTQVNGVQVEGEVEVPNRALLEIGVGGPKIRVTVAEMAGVNFAALRAGGQDKPVKPGRRMAATERHQALDPDDLAERRRPPEPFRPTFNDVRLATEGKWPLLFLLLAMAILIAGVLFVAL